MSQPPAMHVSRAACHALALVAAAYMGHRAAAQDAPTEPRLVRSTLTLAPTPAQLATVPGFAAEWWVPPNIAPDLGRVLTAWQFSPRVIDRLRQAARAQPDGSALITPEVMWLDEFTPGERTRWLVLLGLHRDNITYRWPLAVPNRLLEQLAGRREFGEVVRRVRQWGQPADTFTIFGDLWALEDAFASAGDRREFLRAALSNESTVLKLRLPDERSKVAAEAAYWQVNGRYRAIEPFYNAVLRVKDHDRIDLAHLLPRFARSLLHTFPPEYGAGRDLGVETSTVAASFFTGTTENLPALEEGFSTWLQRECVAVTDAARFGDIFVFEDPTRVRWPYAAVYVADGFVFGRRPTLLGAWQFLKPGDIAHLNPRLGATPATVYRRRSTLAGGDDPRYHVGILPARWQQPVTLHTGKVGPWGRLVSYGVLLAPSSDMLDGLPPPPGPPQWDLLLPDPQPLLKDLAAMDMPTRTRQEILALLTDTPRPPGPVLTVHPSLELVLKIPGPVRGRIFRHLIPGTRSDAYSQTVRIASRASAEEWFAPDALPEPTRTALLGLTYPVGRSFAFSDYGALFAVLPKERDARLSALQTVFSSPALVVMLEKPAVADIPALVSYWERDQQKDLTALLTAFATNDDARYLDIMHLLPPLAREFMNLYAFTSIESPAASCYWTALNFDVDQPDARLLTTATDYGPESALAWEKLQTEFEPVDAPGAFGDVLAYREKSGRRELTHVCVFIADDIVFTKNGLGLMAPWCLMRLADVDSLYLDDRVERRCFRRKPPANRH